MKFLCEESVESWLNVSVWSVEICSEAKMKNLYANCQTAWEYISGVLSQVRICRPPNAKPYFPNFICRVIVDCMYNLLVCYLNFQVRHQPKKKYIQNQSTYFLDPKSVIQTSSPQASAEKVIFPPAAGLPFSSAVYPFAVPLFSIVRR